MGMARVSDELDEELIAQRWRTMCPDITESEIDALVPIADQAHAARSYTGPSVMLAAYRAGVARRHPWPPVVGDVVLAWSKDKPIGAFWTRVPNIHGLWLAIVSNSDQRSLLMDSVIVAVLKPPFEYPAPEHPMVLP